MDKIMSLIFGIFAVICALGIVYNVFAKDGVEDKIFPLMTMCLLCFLVSKVLMLKTRWRC